MITFAFGILFGLGTFALSHGVGDFGLGWSIFFSLLAFGIFQAVAGIFIQKRVKAEMACVEAILTSGQKRLQAKMQAWQFRPPGSVAEAQRLIFADTKAFVNEALARTDGLKKFRFWVPMMDRQIATAKIQLSWMIKDFKTVDELMPKAIFVDPMMSCIKMARLFMLDRPTAEIEKVYRKGVGRVRYNGNVLLAATMSWIQVRRNELDAAFRTLTDALKKSDDATLKRNHEVLMNNHAARFTNSSLGDSWYALLLEEPKIKQQRTRPIYR